jgi:predicted negative regulator of RcsB-dependent stress response
MKYTEEDQLCQQIKHIYHENTFMLANFVFLTSLPVADATYYDARHKLCTA